jgi:hypothetical protein
MLRLESIKNRKTAKNKNKNKNKNPMLCEGS